MIYIIIIFDVINLNRLKHHLLTSLYLKNIILKHYEYKMKLNGYKLCLNITCKVIISIFRS